MTLRTFLKPLSFIPALLIMYMIFHFSGQEASQSSDLSYRISYKIVSTVDYLIDMGPEGGEGGGNIIAEGTPEEVALVPESYTGKYLKEIL